MHLLIDQSPSEIVSNFEPSTQFPNWKKRLIRETKILDKIREPVNRLNKIQFQKRFIEDRLFATLPNMDSWLVQCFAKLNQMAEKTHGKKT